MIKAGILSASDMRKLMSGSSNEMSDVIMEKIHQSGKIYEDIKRNYEDLSIKYENLTKEVEELRKNNKNKKKPYRALKNISKERGLRIYEKDECTFCYLKHELHNKGTDVKTEYICAGCLDMAIYETPINSTDIAYLREKMNIGMECSFCAHEKAIIFDIGICDECFEEHKDPYGELSHSNMDSDVETTIIE
jgi:DNA repair exonuclease SbcCD ATPase subunit